MTLISPSLFISKNNFCLIELTGFVVVVLFVETTGTGKRFRDVEKRHGEKISRGQLRNTTGTFVYQIFIPYLKKISKFQKQDFQFHGRSSLACEHTLLAAL